MKISLKLLLYTHKIYSDGKHPVVLQFIIDGKVTKRVIHKCEKKNWDYKTNRVKPKVEGSAIANNHIYVA